MSGIDLLSKERFDPERKLYVVEFNGTPRSDKGSANEGLAARYPNSATDETGADYRAVMWGILFDKLIDEELPLEQIGDIVRKLDIGQLTDYAARRWEIVSEYGKDVLYEPLIADRVAEISEIDVVRRAVKGGFKRRVQAKKREGQTAILFVDGRHLSEIINEIEDVDLLLSYFIKCSNDKAAQRDTSREVKKRIYKGVPMTDTEEESYYDATLLSITRRRFKDENRDKDKVIEDTNALQFWHNSRVIHSSAEQYAHRFGVSMSEARKVIDNNYYSSNRSGVGRIARHENRQIVLDTNPIGKDEMVERIHNTIEEALDA